MQTEGIKAMESLKQQQLQNNVKTSYTHMHTHAHIVISVLAFVRGESLPSLCSRVLLLIALSDSLSLLLCSCCVCYALCLKQRHTRALMSRLRATQRRSPISRRAAATLTASEATRRGTDLQSAGRQLQKANDIPGKDVGEVVKCLQRQISSQLRDWRGEDWSSVIANLPHSEADSHSTFLFLSRRTSPLHRRSPAMEEMLTCSRSPFSQVFGRQGQLMQASECKHQH